MSITLLNDTKYFVSCHCHLENEVSSAQPTTLQPSLLKGKRRKMSSMQITAKRCSSGTTCGLLWLLAAYLHAFHRHRVQSKRGKRALGIFVLFSFLGHQVCSLRCLIINSMDQHILPWFMLMTNLTVSSGYFVLGMYALIGRDIKAQLRLH